MSASLLRTGKLMVFAPRGHAHSEPIIRWLEFLDENDPPRKIVLVGKGYSTLMAADWLATHSYYGDVLLPEAEKRVFRASDGQDVIGRTANPYLLMNVAQRVGVDRAILFDDDSKIFRRQLEKLKIVLSPDNIITVNYDMMKRMGHGDHDELVSRIKRRAVSAAAW